MDSKVMTVVAGKTPRCSGRASWYSVPQPLVLSHGEVHVWRLSLAPNPATLRDMSELLNDEERRRAGRFHFTRDRDRFVAARGSLRLLLGGYLNRPPNAVCFRYSGNGRPELEGDESNPCWSFNVSHSHDVGLCAVARGRRVGVDVERVRPDALSCVDIADQYFTAPEARTIRSAPPRLQAQVFFRFWTRKEAYLKGVGEGLSAPLNRFEVSLDHSSILLADGVEDGPRWTLRELQPSPGYVAAVAVEGAGFDLKLWVLS